MLVLNKVDTLPGGADGAAAGKVAALLATLNPTAKLVRAVRAEVPLTAVLHTKAFDMARARRSAGWLASLTGGHVPESVEFGITHTVFRARRPFHPARLYTLLFGAKRRRGREGAASGDGPLGSVVRSKGIAWLGTEWGSRQRLDWAQAGRVWQFTPGAPWMADVPREEWAPEAAADMAALGTWSAEPHVGDREQEIVLIGVDMDVDAVVAALTAALVTDAEWSGVYLPATALSTTGDGPGGATGAAGARSGVAIGGGLRRAARKAAAAMAKRDWAGPWDWEGEVVEE